MIWIIWDMNLRRLVFAPKPTWWVAACIGTILVWKECAWGGHGMLPFYDRSWARSTTTAIRCPHWRRCMACTAYTCMERIKLLIMIAIRWQPIAMRWLHHNWISAVRAMQSHFVDVVPLIWLQKYCIFKVCFPQKIRFFRLALWTPSRQEAGFFKSLRRRQSVVLVVLTSMHP